MPRPSPTYALLLARQATTGRQQSWLDALPSELQVMIWKEHFKGTLAQVREFGRYRAVIRLYLERYLENKYYDDVKFSRDGHLFLRRRKGQSRWWWWYTPDEPGAVYRNLVPLFTPPCEGSRGRVFPDVPAYLPLVFTRASAPLPALYGLCKATPPDWDYIGRIGERTASRYTSDRVISHPLDVD